jgi:hypothetical protein
MSVSPGVVSFTVVLENCLEREARRGCAGEGIVAVVAVAGEAEVEVEVVEMDLEASLLLCRAGSKK